MSEATKYFTPGEATRTLPLVRRIVEDILATGRALRALAPEGEPPAKAAAEFRQLAARIRELLQELEELGCSYKDMSFTMGLVDFPARIGGKDVLLCWRPDEDALKYYHAEGEGYRGRKEIPTEYL